MFSQIQRSAVSIPANIAEGFRKRGNDDKAWFMIIAQGFLEESSYFLILAMDLKYCDSSQPLLQIEEVGKLLGAITIQFWFLTSEFCPFDT